MFIFSSEWVTECFKGFNVAPVIQDASRNVVNFM